MSFNSNIPQPGDYISQSQSAILDNFTALDSWGNGYGAFTLQGVAPSFVAGVDGLYNLNYPFNSVNELYVHVQRNGSADAPSEIPFTASCMSNTIMASCSNGWSYLPSGVLIKWGKVLATSNSIFTVDVASNSGGPDFNAVFSVQVSPLWGSTLDLIPNGYQTILASNGSAPTGNFTVSVNPYDAVNSYINYLVIGV